MGLYALLLSSRPTETPTFQVEYAAGARGASAAGCARQKRSVWSDVVRSDPFVKQICYLTNFMEDICLFYFFILLCEKVTNILLLYTSL
jgi:hypothetical protein